MTDDKTNSEIKLLRRERKALIDAGLRAIGEHSAPHDCYATGPLTGDAFLDLVQCPACAFLSLVKEYSK